VPVSRYEVVVRSQAGAEDLLRTLGALDEIEEAVRAHCEGEALAQGACTENAGNAA
jgi:hypothetical protein